MGKCGASLLSVAIQTQVDMSIITQRTIKQCFITDGGKRKTKEASFNAIFLRILEAYSTTKGAKA